MLKEKRPCFKDREWYTIPLMVTRRGKKGKVLKVTYEAQRRPVSLMHKHIGVKSRKVTHMSRASGAKYMARMNLPRHLILKHGRWLNTPYDKAYGTDLQTKPLLAMAGVTGAALKHLRYYLPRSQVPPPLELLDMVLPGFAKDLEFVLTRYSQLPFEDQDSSAVGFLNAIAHLRTVFLQDSAVLQDKYPEAYHFQHPVFEHESWGSYKAMVLKGEAAAVANPDRDFNIPSEVAVGLQDLRQDMAR